MNIDWYLWRNDEKWGPYPQDRFQQMVDDGTIGPRDLVWHEGLKDWTPSKQVIRPSEKVEPPRRRSAAAREFVDAAIERMRPVKYEIEADVVWKGGGCWQVATLNSPAGFLAGANECFFLLETFDAFSFRVLEDFTDDCRRYGLKHRQNPKASLWCFPVAIVECVSEKLRDRIYQTKPEDFTDDLLTLPSVFEEATGYLYYYQNPVMLSWEARHHQRWVGYTNLLCRLLLGK